MYKFRNQVQEQIQIIATAIGKPAAKALTIVKVNAKSGFTGRKLCTDIRFLHYARINRKVAPERMRCRFPLATRVRKGERRWCADMVNERLRQETLLATLPRVRLCHGLLDFSAAVRALVDEVDFRRAPVGLDVSYVHRKS
jgi:hypothetical protein